MSKAIYFDGPAPRLDKDGDEHPEWVVYVGDANAEPLGTVYHVHSYARACELARRMSRDRALELLKEAQPA